MMVRPRLVVPIEYFGDRSPTPRVAAWLEQWGPPEVSASGRLGFLTLLIDEDDLPTVLAVMTDLSEHWLRQHPEAPRLEDVATYEREPKGENDYLALPVTLGYYANEYEAFVDCEDASIGDAAQARVYEGRPNARPVSTYQSRRMRHIVTDLGNGKRRDMSRILLARRKRGN